MHQVALDWNCIIALEEERPAAPFLRQIQAWHNQGKISLCISSPSRLENPQDNTMLTIDEPEWNQKIHIVGLEGIELRGSKPRAFIGADGSYLYDHTLEVLVMQKMHAILFPNIDFLYYDYCRRMHQDPLDSHSFPNMSDSYRAASPEQQRINRKWNNAKCDSLSLYAYSTWAEVDDLFVTTDQNFQPFQMQRLVLAPSPEYAGMIPTSDHVLLTEQIQNVTVSNVIRGHIMTPQEAIAFLQERLVESHQKDSPASTSQKKG